MSHRFVFEPGIRETAIRLVGPSGTVPWRDWALKAPEPLLPGVDLAQRLLAEESAIEVDDAILVKSEIVAGLNGREGAALGLPGIAETVARLEARGLMTSQDYRIDLTWERPNGQAIPSAERIGPWFSTGRETKRLPDALFAIAEAVDRLNATDGVTEDRLKALAALHEVLPAGAEAGLAEAKGAVGSMTIAVADAFSLDMQTVGKEPRLIPILHKAGGAADTPLLDPERQGAFSDRFASASEVVPVVALGRGRYVVLQPNLRKALAEVRRVNGASLAARRAFMANPRRQLRETFGEEIADAILDTVYRDTQAYSDRVVGLGLWTPRVVPWIALPTADWFGDGDGKAADRGSAPKPQMGIRVGDRIIPLDPPAARSLAEKVERAIARGEPSVDLEVETGEPGTTETVKIPAVHETLVAIQKAETAALAAHRSPEPGKAKSDGAHVLIIRPNEEELEIDQDVAPGRPAPSLQPPAALATSLLPHQRDGLGWLQRAWTRGLPGVLLADDMGLGKTIQGLAFLAWLRDGMAAGQVPAGPLLIVAPTGLLRNWRAEHDRHLSGPGLGPCLEAFGRGLGALKGKGPDGRLTLDTARLAQAAWVLTTYETLRDFDKDFGQVRFAAALFDEAQKIKTPGVRITDAAKAMNCDFRVALTGTPVENRLADLWCITDGVHPGVLGDLKSFSARFEKDLDAEKLKTLKSTLERPAGGYPPIMLRRLKQDRLPDLPTAEERRREIPMPPVQRAAYESVVESARATREPGAVLGALQRLLAVSLHPAPEAAGPDDLFIAASARLLAAFESLDVIAARREKALVFVNDLAMQARLAGLIQRRYGLASPPALINGDVDGTTRQVRVDAFQASPEGFDVMILSPRAGGVGLTLTRANHALFLSRWWNPAVEDQCTGRVLRIGQKRPVSIHLPLAVRGDGQPSFDQNLDALLARKRKLMADTLMPPDATDKSDQDELFRASVA